MAAPIPVDNTLGALLVGTWLGIFMYGLVVHQLFHYFVKSPKDPLLIKTWVIVVFVLETYTIIIGMQGAYHYTVTNWANPAILAAKTPPTFVTAPAISTLTAVLVELFFARRVWMLGPNFRPVVLVALLFLFTFYGLYMATVIVGLPEPNPAAYFDRVARLSGFALAFLEAADIMITSVLVWVLHTSHSGFRRTDSMIDVLIKYAVTTQIVTCIFLTVALILTFLRGDTLIWFAAELCLVNLHALVFYTTLNVRDMVTTFNDIGTVQRVNYSSASSRSNAQSRNFRGPVRRDAESQALGTATNSSMRIELKSVGTQGRNEEAALGRDAKVLGLDASA